MEHILSVFAGRKGLGNCLGNSTAYRSSHPGKEVERFHAVACTALGVRWRYLYDDRFGFTAEQAAPFLAWSDLALLLYEDPNPYDKRYPYELNDDVDFRDFYLHVAAWGAKREGVTLLWSAIEIDDINAGGEVHGAVQ